MSDCIFCNIINGEATAAVVYEDDNTLAFMDIGQVNPGHLVRRVVEQQPRDGVRRLPADPLPFGKQPPPGPQKTPKGRGHHPAIRR